MSASSPRLPHAPDEQRAPRRTIELRTWRRGVRLSATQAGACAQGRMRSDRLRRVDEAIRQVIGDVLAVDIKDPRVGFVTVTDVRTSPDLRHAHVYISVLGGPAEREASMHGLRSAHGFLQRAIATELRLKRTPTLQFHYDQTTDRAMRIEGLLREETDA